MIASVYSTTQAQLSLAPHKWHSVDLTPLPPDGTLPVAVGQTDKIYDISDLVPNDAKEVLIYVTIRNSNLINPGGINFKIFTKNNNKEFAKYLYWDAAGSGGHVAYNSANIWLPITSDKIVRCTKISKAGGTRGVISSISIIGYR